MRNSHLTLQTVQNLFVKNLADESHVFMTGDNASVVHRYAAAFLTSVLQCKKSVIAGISRCDTVITVYSEDAAFLVQFFAEPVS